MRAIPLATALLGALSLLGAGGCADFRGAPARERPTRPYLQLVLDGSRAALRNAVTNFQQWISDERGVLRVRSSADEPVRIAITVPLPARPSRSHSCLAFN